MKERKKRLRQNERKNERNGTSRQKCNIFDKIFNAFNREIKMGMFENARRYKVTKREIAL